MAISGEPWLLDCIIVYNWDQNSKIKQYFYVSTLEHWVLISEIEAMYRVCGLGLVLNFGVRLEADKNFYLRLTVEKMRAFGVFTEKYLQPYRWRDSNVTVVAICTNSKTEIKSVIIEYKSSKFKSSLQ